MVEILRRVALVVGVYGAVVVFLYTRPGLVHVADVDFAARKAAAPGWRQDPAQSLEDYVAEAVRDRRAEASGAGWGALVAALRAPGSSGGVWLLPDDALLDGLRPGVDRHHRFVYAQLRPPAGPAWLGVTWRSGRDATGAPDPLVRPLRWQWPWWALGGVLLYALLPRKRRGADTLGYGLMSAGVMPDLVGLLLGGTFFTLGLVVPRAIADDGRMLVPELWPLYAVFGLLMAVAWATHAAAARYSAYRLQITDEALTQRTLFAERTIRLADIVEARAVVRRAPRWLRTLMWVASFLNPRAMGQAAILASRADPELLVREANGRETRILLTALEGHERLHAALADRLVDPD